MEYDLIPIELREEVRRLILCNDSMALLKIHDTYKLTPYNYGCCNTEGMMNFFRYGLKNNLI